MKGAHDFACALQLLDLMGGHVQQLETLTGTVQQRTGRAAALRRGGLTQGFPIGQGDEKLPLRRHQFGGVQGQEDLVALDFGTGLVDAQALDPTGSLGMQACQVAFVQVHLAQGSDRVGQIAPFHLGHAHTDVLHDHRVDLHRAHRLARVLFLVRIDGDVIHAHLVLGRHRRSDGRIHGVAVVKDLALLLFGLGLVGIDRDVVHAHFILGRHRRSDGRIHGIAVVEDLAFAPTIGTGGGRRLFTAGAGQPPTAGGTHRQGHSEGGRVTDVHDSAPFQSALRWRPGSARRRRRPANGDCRIRPG